MSPLANLRKWSTFVTVAFLLVGLAVTVQADSLQSHGELNDEPSRNAAELVAYFPSTEDFANTTNRSLEMSSIDLPVATNALIIGKGDFTITTDCIVAVAAPEPASLLLLGTGLVAVTAGVRRRLRNRS